MNHQNICTCNHEESQENLSKEVHIVNGILYRYCYSCGKYSFIETLNNQEGKGIIND